MRKLLFILFFSIFCVRAEASTVGGWYLGRWSCLIDGRPSTMVWEVKNDPQQTGDGNVGSQTSGVKIVGWFREQPKNSPWVRLYLKDSTNTGLRMLYNNVDPWVLNLRQSGSAVGHTTWQGRRYPLQCQKI